MAVPPAAARTEPAPALDRQGRPEPIPAENFAKRVNMRDARLSATGKRFAYSQTVDGKVFIRVYDADTGALTQTLDFGEPENYRWFRWAGDDKLLVSLLPETNTAFFWNRASRLMLYDLASGETSYVGLKQQGFAGDQIEYIDPAGRFVLMAISARPGQTPGIYRIMLDGTGPDTAVKLVDNDRDIDAWWTDTQGVVRLGIGLTQRNAMIVHYRSGEGEDFERITKLDKDEKDARDAWDVMGIYPGRDVGHAIVGKEDGKRVLVEMNYRTGEQGAVVYEDERWDVEEVLVDDRMNVIGVQLTADGPRQVFFDPVRTRMQKELSQALGGAEVLILSSVADRRFLVLQQGSSDPGALYVYTPAQGTLALVDNLRPEIDYRVMASTSAHDISTRDGKTMRAFLTLPRGRSESDLPLVLMPHGGPFGVRDAATYNDWVQLFANRGYAVLQPNFRGSAGYGKAFEEAGEGEIGRKMQDDLDDAVKWAIAQGYADAARVCIAGASYGGYAALWGAVRNPELYRCAISWAGVTDFEEQLKYDRNYLGRKFYREKWRDQVRGEDRKFDLDAVSPATNIARLTRPVLLAHGKKDKRVPFEQFERMVDAAKDAGIAIETLELDDGHRLSEEENEAKLLQAMADFLAQHNPAD